VEELKQVLKKEDVISSEMPWHVPTDL